MVYQSIETNTQWIDTASQRLLSRCTAHTIPHVDAQLCNLLIRHTWFISRTLDLPTLPPTLATEPSPTQIQALVDAAASALAAGTPLATALLTWRATAAAAETSVAGVDHYNERRDQRNTVAHQRVLARDSAGAVYAELAAHVTNMSVAEPAAADVPSPGSELPSVEKEAIVVALASVLRRADASAFKDSARSDPGVVAELADTVLGVRLYESAQTTLAQVNARVQRFADAEIGAKTILNKLRTIFHTEFAPLLMFAPGATPAGCPSASAPASAPAPAAQARLAAEAASCVLLISTLQLIVNELHSIHEAAQAAAAAVASAFAATASITSGHTAVPKRAVYPRFRAAAGAWVTVFGVCSLRFTAIRGALAVAEVAAGASWLTARSGLSKTALPRYTEMMQRLAPASDAATAPAAGAEVGVGLAPPSSAQVPYIAFNGFDATALVDQGVFLAPGALAPGAGVSQVMGMLGAGAGTGEDVLGQSPGAHFCATSLSVRGAQTRPSVLLLSPITPYDRFAEAPRTTAGCVMHTLCDPMGALGMHTSVARTDLSAQDRLLLPLVINLGLDVPAFFLRTIVPMSLCDSVEAPPALLAPLPPAPATSVIVAEDCLSAEFVAGFAEAYVSSNYYRYSDWVRSLLWDQGIPRTNDVVTSASTSTENDTNTAVEALTTATEMVCASTMTPIHFDLDPTVTTIPSSVPAPLAPHPVLPLPTPPDNVLSTILYGTKAREHGHDDSEWHRRERALVLANLANKRTKGVQVRDSACSRGTQHVLRDSGVQKSVSAGTSTSRRVVARACTGSTVVCFGAAAGPRVAGGN